MTNCIRTTNRSVSTKPNQVISQQSRTLSWMDVCKNSSNTLIAISNKNSIFSTLTLFIVLSQMLWYAQSLFSFYICEMLGDLMWVTPQINEKERETKYDRQSPNTQFIRMLHWFHFRNIYTIKNYLESLISNPLQMIVQCVDISASFFS